MAWWTQGSKGDKDILLKSITSIQFKQAGLTNGFIQFAFSGSSESKGSVFDATRDENTVMFTAGQQADFEAMRDAIYRQKAELERPRPEFDAAPSRKTNYLDELERLAAFREQGIITDDEFQAKKKQILGI